MIYYLAHSNDTAFSDVSISWLSFTKIDQKAEYFFDNKTCYGRRRQRGTMDLARTVEVH